MRLPLSNVSTAMAAVHKALRLLDPEATGPLHWSAAVPAARRALNHALLALKDNERVPATAAADAWRTGSRTPGTP
jgi:hypothetical protein